MKSNSSHRQGREKKKPAVEEPEPYDYRGRMGKRQEPVEKFSPPPAPERIFTPRPCPFQHSRNVVCPMCDGLDV